MAANEKFENEDIPLILATLKRAHEVKKYARVTGGVVSVQLDIKDKVK